MVVNARFPFFALRSSGGIKYVILIEDSNTGCSISITAMIEYLFAFFLGGGRDRKSHFYFFSWCYSRK